MTDRPDKKRSEFNGYPSLDDLLDRGGVPGLEYALIPAAKTAYYQSKGWDMVARLPVLTIHGPKGSADATLMCTGDPMPQVSRTGVCLYEIHKDLHTKTGLGGPSNGKKHEGSESTQPESQPRQSA